MGNENTYRAAFKRLLPACALLLSLPGSVRAESPGTDELLGTLPAECQTYEVELSRDLRDYACIVRKPDHKLVVVNGKAGPVFEDVQQMQRLSGDEIVYHGHRAGKVQLVVGLVPGKAYEKIHQVARLSTGQIAYEASENTQWFLVIDGKEEKRYDYIEFMKPGPGGKYAYTARRNNKELLVANGKEEPLEFVHVSEAAFSPKGQLAYSARDGKSAVLVLNGKIISRYERIGARVFSAQERLAFHALEGEDEFVEAEGPRYRDVWGPLFSPDSEYMIYAALDENNRLWRRKVRTKPDTDRT